MLGEGGVAVEGGLVGDGVVAGMLGLAGFVGDGLVEDGLIDDGLVVSLVRIRPRRLRLLGLVEFGLVDGVAVSDGMVDGVIELGDAGVLGGWVVGWPGVCDPGPVIWARTGEAPISAAAPAISKSLCISKVLANWKSMQLRLHRAEYLRKRPERQIVSNYEMQ